MLTYSLHLVRLLRKLNLFLEILCHVLLKNFCEIFQNLYHFIVWRQKIVDFFKKSLILFLSTISLYFEISWHSVFTPNLPFHVSLYFLQLTTGTHAMLNWIKCLHLNAFKRFNFLFLCYVYRENPGLIHPITCLQNSSCVDTLFVVGPAGPQE